MAIFRKIFKHKIEVILVLFVLMIWFKQTTEYIGFKEERLKLDNNITPLKVNTNMTDRHVVLLNYQEMILENKENEALNSKLDNKQNPCDIYKAPWRQNRGSFHIPADTKSYFFTQGYRRCLKEGVNITELVSNTTQCPCKHGWLGTYCSIPEAVMLSNCPFDKYPATPIWDRPVRKVINAFVFDLEFDFLEARLAEFGDLVDAFLILESNHTSDGIPKPLHLLERLKKGFYAEHACKIVHVVINKFSEGKKAEESAMDYLGSQGLVHQLTGCKEEDLMVINEPDEIPRRSVILYLKTHTGYPEPISVQMTWSFYGYFWLHSQMLWVADSILSIHFLRRVLQYKAHHIRRIRDLAAQVNASNTASLNSEDKGIVGRWKEYDKIRGGKLHHWMVGSVDSQWKPFSTHSGWYCRYCFKPEDIVTTLATGIRGDSLKWREFSEYRNITIIKELVKTGVYFKNQKFTAAANMTRQNFAPKHFMQNADKYKHILVNPYRKDG